MVQVTLDVGPAWFVWPPNMELLGVDIGDVRVDVFRPPDMQQTLQHNLSQSGQAILGVVAASGLVAHRSHHVEPRRPSYPLSAPSYPYIGVLSATLLFLRLLADGE